MVMKPLVLLAAAGLGILPGVVQDTVPSGLVPGKEIALEGGTSFDLVTVDSEAQRLYVAHSPRIDVIDLKKGEKVGEVSGVEGAHQAVAVPAVKRGFATAGQKNKMIVFDLETLKGVKEIETGQNPDGILYVSSQREVWAFNGRSKNVTCVNSSTLEVTATIALDGKPELSVENASKGLVYLNLEDKSSIAVLDAKTHAVLETHSIAPGDGPTGLAFDEKHGLLFAGCANKKLVAVDITSWKVVGQAEIGQRCDGAAFDPGTGNAYASCNDQSGGLHVKDATTLQPLTPFASPGGKTCALDPSTYTLYIVAGPPRGQKGTVKVLVFAPK
jgi:DNA-binding beta-propeller fold protein YncE